LGRTNWVIATCESFTNLFFMKEVRPLSGLLCHESVDGVNVKDNG